MVNVETLDDAVEQIFKSGILLRHRFFILVVWTDDTEDCKPITRAFGVRFPEKLNHSIIKNVFSGINSKLWILSIEDEDGNIYDITKAQEFANRGCA